MMNLSLPTWHERLPHCMRCGYDLAGVAVDVPCPECGASTGPFFVLAGVPQSLGGSTGRRVARGFVMVGAFLSAQMVLALMFIHWAAAVGAVAVFGGIVTWLLVSSPRERGGAERFVFGTSGLARIAAKNDAVRGDDESFVKFEASTQVQFVAVGAKWGKFRVVDGSGKKCFEAGVRVDTATLGKLIEDLQTLVASQGVQVMIVPRFV